MTTSNNPCKVYYVHTAMVHGNYFVGGIFCIVMTYHQSPCDGKHNRFFICIVYFLSLLISRSLYTPYHACTIIPVWLVNSYCMFQIHNLYKNYRNLHELCSYVILCTCVALSCVHTECGQVVADMFHTFSFVCMQVVAQSIIYTYLLVVNLIHKLRIYIYMHLCTHQQHLQLLKIYTLLFLLSKYVGSLSS